MRRTLFITLLFLTVACIAYAWIRHSPLLLSHFSDKTIVADSVRKHKLYNTALTGSVDSIVVIKHLREMYVYRDKALLKIFRIALGDAPAGHKHFKGDEKTPEGLYRIDGKNPYSVCHKNLGISYPNAADRAYAASKKKPAGGDIKIHGLPNGQGYIGKAHLLSDWTNGCIGITDEEIDELYKYTTVGVPIFILP